MYIRITHLGNEDETQAAAEAQAGQRDADGFRWSMLARPLQDTEGGDVAVSMWLTPEAEQTWREAASAPAPTHGCDVTTARGSMTPAAGIAVVSWTVPEAQAAAFAARWNAYYHAIEDRIGNRLLQDLETPNRYYGLHAVVDMTNLDPATLSAELTDDGLKVAPETVSRFEVTSLTEAP